MIEQPLVSVVTPSFNQARFLELAMLSVLEQDYPRIEYIVIDGGSTDESLSIIKRNASRLAYWTSEPDQGQAEAINKGLRRAQGQLVAWLNSDDVYLPGTISDAVQVAHQHPQAGMVYADGYMVDSEERLLDPHRYRTLTALDLLSFEVLLQPTVFMRRSALEAAGYLDRSYDLILDHELWLRIASGHQLVHVPRFWALERTHKEAKTIQRAAGFVEEAYRLVERAAESPELGQLVRGQHARIYAGLHVFSARRLIDAGEHREAVKHLWTAARLHPATVARYWYKVVQALGSAAGLEGLFMWYRSSRRRLKYGRRRIDLPYGEAED